jgi:hypothetical protein
MEETMKAASRFWRYLLTPIALAGMLSISSAAELNPAAVIYKLPDQIQWSPVNAAGAHFGKQVHWDGAKDEDAVLLILGEGPATSTAAEEK